MTDLNKVNAGATSVEPRQTSAQRAAQQQARRQARRAGDTRVMAFGAAFLALVAGWVTLYPKPPAPSGARTAPAPAAPAAAPAGATKVPAAPAAETRRPGRHVGVGNDVLALEAVEFAYRTGPAGVLEPHMTVTVKNISDRAIASARLDARLYNEGAASPVVDTGTGGSFDNKPLYVFFPDEGLAPGARRKVEVGLSGDERWSAPDAANASGHTLVLRVGEVTDGRKQAFGAGPHAWPALASAPGAAVLRPASPTMDEHDYRQRFFAGEHVVLSDSRVTIDDLDVDLRDDGAGGEKAVMHARFSNRSGVTLGSVAFRVQLFITGETTPALDSKDGGGVQVFFHGAGLADGASVKQDFSDSGRAWDAPELRKAIRDGNVQLVLRLESISDGRKRTFPSAAIPVRAL